MTILRAYLGETSNTVIAMLPPEKQKKSTIKYTNFFLTFTMTAVCDAVGPGTYIMSIIRPAICNQYKQLTKAKECHTYTVPLLVTVFVLAKLHYIYHA